MEGSSTGRYVAELAIEREQFRPHLSYVRTIAPPLLPGLRHRKYREHGAY